MNYISTYCRISNGKIVVDGKQLTTFSNPFPDFMERVYTELVNDYPKFYKMDNLSKLGFLASEFLLKHRSLKQIDPYDVAIVLSNSSASLDTDVKYEEASRNVPSPGLFVYTLANIVNGEISIRNGFKGESSFLVTSAFDPDIVFTQCDAILEKKAKICVAGWVEVMGSTYDAFLYLVEKEHAGKSIEHLTENIRNLYYS